MAKKRKRKPPEPEYTPPLGFARYLMALAMARGDLNQAIEIAKRWPDTPEVEATIRAVQSGAKTSDPL